MNFSSREQFELHVHKCFGKIFDSLLKMDSKIKAEAKKEEDSGCHGPMCDIRDEIEEVILHCHLAWQYHRLSKSASSNVWDSSDATTAKE